MIRYNKNYKKIDQDKELIMNKFIISNIYKRIISQCISFFDEKTSLIVVK